MKTLFSRALVVCYIGQLVAAPVNAQILSIDGLKTDSYILFFHYLARREFFIRRVNVTS